MDHHNNNNNNQSSWLPSKSQSYTRKPEKPTKPKNEKPGISSYNGLRASRKARLLNALNGRGKKKKSSVTIGIKRNSQSLYDFEADRSYEDDEISSRVDTIMATLKPSYDLLSKNGPRAIDGEWITSPRIYKTKILSNARKQEKMIKREQDKAYRMQH